MAFSVSISPSLMIFATIELTTFPSLFDSFRAFVLLVFGDEILLLFIIIVVVVSDEEDEEGSASRLLIVLEERTKVIATTAII